MKGFTLTELLVVCSIVALTAAVSAPAISAAKESAQVTRCTGNLRQIGIAVALYREEQGEKVAYGHPIDMGLPPLAGDAVARNWELMQCRGSRVQQASYTQFWPPKGRISDEMFERELPRWLAYIESRQGAAIMEFDDNHNREFMSDWETYFAVGINFDLTVIRKRGRGFPSKPGWWKREPQVEATR